MSMNITVRYVTHSGNTKKLGSIRAQFFVLCCCELVTSPQLAASKMDHRAGRPPEVLLSASTLAQVITDICKRCFVNDTSCTKFTNRFSHHLKIKLGSLAIG